MTNKPPITSDQMGKFIVQCGEVISKVEEGTTVFIAVVRPSHPDTFEVSHNCIPPNYVPLAEALEGVARDLRMTASLTSLSTEMPQ